MQPKPRFSKTIFRSMLEMLRRNLIPEPTLRADAWKVPSASVPCQTYTVTIEDRDARLVAMCTCKAGQAKRGCKHALLVLREFERDNRHWIALLNLQAAERQAA
jgi:SWIM zinc finger